MGDNESDKFDKNFGLFEFSGFLTSLFSLQNFRCFGFLFLCVAPQSKSEKRGREALNVSQLNTASQEAKQRCIC